METSCKKLVKENQDLKTDGHFQLAGQRSNMDEAEVPEILDMPDSIFLHIFSFLPFSSVGPVAQVCQRWSRIANDELLWKDLFLRHYKLPLDTKMPVKAHSWMSEFKRLYYHSPCVLSEERKEHRDEVLHISFSHDGTMFATCSKDGFFKVWECSSSSSRPCRLLFEKDMMTSFSWKFTQFSQFNETDTCLLVSGVYFGSLSTSGEIAVFDLQDDFNMQCRVTNKPYDVFGAWYDNNHLLSGTLYWTGDFNSVSAVWLSKASQEVESEMESVSMVLYRFENRNSSSIRLLHVAEVERKDDDDNSEFERSPMEHSPSPSAFLSRENGAMAARDDGMMMSTSEASSWSAISASLSNYEKVRVQQENLLDKLLMKNIAEDEFDLENEDETEEEEGEKGGSGGDDNMMMRQGESSRYFGCNSFVEGGGAGNKVSYSSGSYGNYFQAQDCSTTFDNDEYSGNEHSVCSEGLEMDNEASCHSYFDDNDECHRGETNTNTSDKSQNSSNYFSGGSAGVQDSTSNDFVSACADKLFPTVPNSELARNEPTPDYPQSLNRLYVYDSRLQANNNVFARVLDDLNFTAGDGDDNANNTNRFSTVVSGGEACNKDGVHRVELSQEGTQRRQQTMCDERDYGCEIGKGGHSCEKKSKSESSPMEGTDDDDDNVGYNILVESPQKDSSRIVSTSRICNYDDSNYDFNPNCSNYDSNASNNTNTDICCEKNSSGGSTSYGTYDAVECCSGMEAMGGVATCTDAATAAIGGKLGDNNDNYPTTAATAFASHSSQTQTEESASGSLTSSFHSMAHMSHSSSVSREVLPGNNKRSTEKLLIYTWGSETYIPHKVGIKRIRRSDFCKGEVKARHSSMLLPDVMANLHNMVEDRRDVPDVSIDMHGHIVGLSLSPDQRYLYVNCRAWPQNYIISDPQESPPLAQEVEISTVDLTTFQFVGPVLRSHKAYTHSDECFFLNLDVSEDYVVSGAEDRRGYIWDRHYGICLGQFEHRSVVNCMAVCPSDPEVAVSVSDDHTFKVWVSRSKKREAERQSQRDKK